MRYLEKSIIQKKLASFSWTSEIGHLRWNSRIYSKNYQNRNPKMYFGMCSLKKYIYFKWFCIIRTRVCDNKIESSRRFIALISINRICSSISFNCCEFKEKSRFKQSWLFWTFPNLLRCWNFFLLAKSTIYIEIVAKFKANIWKKGCLYCTWSSISLSSLDRE